MDKNNAKDYLEFKVHEFLEDVDKMDKLIWDTDEDKEIKE